MPKVQSAVYCRPPWERMMRLHQLLVNGEYPNCSQIAREFEVTARTVKRDVDFMKHRLNLPLEYDPKRYGYYYSRPVEHFPQVPVSEREIFALLVAHKAIAQYHGTPFQQPLETAFKKLACQLNGNSSLTIGDLEHVLSFRPFAPEDTDLENFEIITRALQQRRALKFLYKNLGADKSQQRNVHPYHLACIENHWYLFAFDVRRQAMRTFALTRLRKPEITAERFTIPKKFDANEYLKGSFGVFKGGDDYEVVIDFDAWATDLLRGRKWHPSQQFTQLPGGESRLCMRLNNIEEIERWVLSWGTHATIVRPGTLAERIGSIGKALAQRYLTSPSLVDHIAPSAAFPELTRAKI